MTGGSPARAEGGAEGRRTAPRPPGGAEQAAAGIAGARAGRKAARLRDRLGVRLALLLGLALLPVGLMGAVQTWRVLVEARERVEAALLSQTMQAAAQERDEIRSAIGAARVFAITLDTLPTRREECLRLFGEFVRGSESVVFAGFVDADGVMLCSSERVSMRFTDSPLFRELRAAPRLMVQAAPHGPLSGAAVVFVTVPVLRAGRFAGAITVSLRLTHALERIEAVEGVAPLDLVTFNAEGEILNSARGPLGLETRLPAGVSLAELARQAPLSFTGHDGAGRERVFSVVPIVGDTVHALASWPAAVSLSPWRLPLSTVAVPLAMWVVSLVVAYVAVHLLVVRHVRRLVGQIRAFGGDRRPPAPPSRGQMPAELAEVAETFAAMAERIRAHEAVLEASLEEKNTLLREVHHRVRNNLQLIASMIGMQLRAARDDETSEILRRLRERVSGLARVHRALYEAASLASVQADRLLAEIIDQMLGQPATAGPDAGPDTGATGPRLDVRRHLEPVRLEPDQAVPLALLATEAVTNALKYAGRSGEGRGPWIEVGLTNAPDGTVSFTVANPVGTSPAAAGSGERLGGRLIAAFAHQLGGEVTQGAQDGIWRVTLRFRPGHHGDGAGTAARSGAQAGTGAAAGAPSRA